MTKLDKLKMNTEDAVKLLTQIASSLGASPLSSENKGGNTHLRFGRDGEEPALLIIIGTEKKGLTVSASMGRNKKLGSDIISELSNQVESQKVSTGVAVYTVDDEAQRRSIYDDIKAIDGVSVSDVSFESHSNYVLDVCHLDRMERVRMTQHSTGKLVLQGKTWEVWDAVCTCVEISLGATATDVLCRFVANQDKVLVENIITHDVRTGAEAALRSRASDVYDYLWDHDQKCLLSAQYLVQSRLELPEYTAYVAPAGKALEGFLKKCAIGIGVPAQEVASRDFLFLTR